MKKQIALITLAAVLFVSCKLGNTPEEYIGCTTLNTNLLRDFGARDFNRMQSDKNANQLLVPDGNQYVPAKSFVEYNEKMTIADADEHLKKIEDLKVTDETKDLISNSEDLFTTAKKIYETDYVTICKMMDEGKPQPEIDTAIAQLERKYDPILQQKFQVLDAVAFPYAAKHGIQLEKN